MEKGDGVRAMTDTERAKQQRFVVERAVDALVMWARRQGREEVLCDAVAQGVRVPLPAEPPEQPGAPPDAEQLRERAYGAGVFTGVDVGQAQAAARGVAFASEGSGHAPATHVRLSAEQHGIPEGAAGGPATVPSRGIARDRTTSDAPGARMHDGAPLSLGEALNRMKAEQAAETLHFSNREYVRQGWLEAAAWLERQWAARFRDGVTAETLVLLLRAESQHGEPKPRP